MDLNRYSALVQEKLYDCLVTKEKRSIMLSWQQEEKETIVLIIFCHGLYYYSYLHGMPI